ncbi:MAG: sulfite exporter TauE/SafE family protein [Alphaproteobacteria bacterium]|nr:sulfite exporter TauE/SafE family protein [Alphaproteobacteria bacterium]
MDILQAIALFAVAVLAGALNSVAGGGSFFTFPALVMTGMNSVVANATNTIALWPGSLASVFAYRRHVTHNWPGLIGPVAWVFLGGLAGAVLLIKTPEHVFNALIPWLMLLAVSVFHWGAKWRAWLARIKLPKQKPAQRQFLLLFLLLVISLYGGYFGGGIGMMLLATLAIMGIEHIHAQNALKTIFASSINGAAVLYFIISGAIDWPHALLMMVGAIIGGYYGAVIAQKIPPERVRVGVLAVGYAMVGYFFLR